MSTFVVQFLQKMAVAWLWQVRLGVVIQELCLQVWVITYSQSGLVPPTSNFGNRFWLLHFFFLLNKLKTLLFSSLAV